MAGLPCSPIPYVGETGHYVLLGVRIPGSRGVIREKEVEAGDACNTADQYRAAQALVLKRGVHIVSPGSKNFRSVAA